MISYRPSIGNNETSVGVTNDGKFFGKSTGGKILLNLRTNDEPKSTYYKNNFTDLSNESSWFFKSITDSDFLIGSTTYRAVYIGASERYDESEILGTISTSVSNDNGDPLLTNSVTTSLWMEGVYTELSSEYSINLEDENDRFDQLSSATWSTSIVYNQELLPGQFIKVWIKIVTDANASVTDFNNFNYFITIGDITFTIPKTPSRLSYSKIFKANLKSDNITLREAISPEFGTSNVDGIFKVIKKQNQINLFYITNCEQGDLQDAAPETTELRLMVVRSGDNLGEYKYVDVSLSPLFDNAVILEESNYQNYLKAMTCDLPITIQSTGSTNGVYVGEYSDKTITVSTSGSGNYITNIIENLPNKKFITDVFISRKEKINYAYVFYAELHTDYVERDILNYQHIYYKWVFKVAIIDLNHINEKLFERINVGYTNKHTSIITKNHIETVKSYFFPTNIVLQDDLFSILGFDTEECYYKNYKSK